MSPKNTKETFLLKIKKELNGCWAWAAALQKDGYGICKFNNKCWLAHRLSYELFIGPIPKELEIDHLCRNRSCVNPEHLETVTHDINMERGDCKANGPRITAFHQNKTHCPNGHPYSGENLTLRQIEGHKPHRECRACKRLHSQKRKAYLRQLDKECEQILESGIW